MKLNKLIQKINKENTPPEGWTEEAMNKKQATKWALSKDNPNREKNKLQGGWTEEAKEGAKIAGSIGLSLNDLNDSGDMAEELADIMNLDSDLYKNLK